MSNTFGKIFKLTTFGESHGVAVGGVVDGCPSNFKLDLNLIQKELARRKPGQSSITTQRKESDKVEFLSGIFEGKTTGAPLGFIIKNENQNPKDYENLKNLFRPSHADYTYQKKFGIRDYRRRHQGHWCHGFGRGAGNCRCERPTQSFHRLVVGA